MKPLVTLWMILSLAPLAILATPPPKDEQLPIYVAERWQASWESDADKAVFVHVSRQQITVESKIVARDKAAAEVDLALRAKKRSKPSILIIVDDDLSFSDVAELAQTFRRLVAESICITYK